MGGSGALRLFRGRPLTDPQPDPVDLIEFTGDLGGGVYNGNFCGVDCCSSSSSSSSNGFNGVMRSREEVFFTTTMSLGSSMTSESSDSNGFNSDG